MIQERLKELRAQMQERGIDIYIVPTSDFHQSEYVGEYFKARKYMTGFTGSAGTAVITKEEAGLWTDGRYFIQAKMTADNLLNFLLIPFSLLFFSDAHFLFFLLRTAVSVPYRSRICFCLSPPLPYWEYPGVLRCDGNVRFSL